jgi:NAD(P)-dependent dehydrogenase (short-subunit alcohol dehydrogenase family)
VCRQLAGLGLCVVLSARRRENAERAARELAREGAVVVALELDVTSAPSIDRAILEVHQRAGPVDVLVNNAAILIAETTTVLETPLADYARTFETNVLGPIAMCQALVPGMAQRRYGRVVNVSSQAGQLARTGTYAPAYSISKTALNAFTKQLAAAVSTRGVLVNAGCPGWVRTDMGGPHAPRSVVQGADTLVWLATLPSNGPTGGFFSDRSAIEW